MAGLGVKVYLDENVDVLVEDALRKKGYDATHAYSEGNRRVDDAQHVRYATSKGWAVVTHNFADFAMHHVDFLRRGEHHEGIILVPVRSLSEVVTRLSHHLESIPPAQQQNNLLWA